MKTEAISTDVVHAWAINEGFTEDSCAALITKLIKSQKELHNPFICIRQYQADEIAEALSIALKYVKDAQTAAELCCVAGTRAADVVTSAFNDESSEIHRALRILQTDAGAFRILQTDAEKHG
jgi:hypothetical protein